MVNPFFSYKKEELQFMKQKHNIKFNPNMKSPNALKNLDKKCHAHFQLSFTPRHNHLCFIKTKLDFVHVHEIFLFNVEVSKDLTLRK
jgi:hypothetical protein